jgi:hypothetical protein
MDNARTPKESGMLNVWDRTARIWSRILIILEYGDLGFILEILIHGCATHIPTREYLVKSKGEGLW